MGGWPETFMWWIDAVGGFWTITRPVIRIGQAGSSGNEIPLLGDVSGRHAELRRGSNGILLIPFAETTVNGKPGEGFVLRDGDRIRMRSVELAFHQPQKWSTTARLEIVSRHRLPLALDGILLLGEMCALGPRRDAHVRTEWESTAFVSWHKDRYWVRAPGPLTIDGNAYDGYGPLRPTSEVSGTWGSFRWEPVTT
jgi:hypothetical protein